MMDVVRVPSSDADTPSIPPRLIEPPIAIPGPGARPMAVV